MKRAKKVLCLVLMAVLAFSLMPVNVFAASDPAASVTQIGSISSLLDDLINSSDSATGPGSSINFGNLIADVTSSSTGTGANAESTLLSVLESLGVSTAQSRSILSALLSGKLPDEGLASLVDALGAADIADASAIADLVAALSSNGFITASGLAAQLGSGTAATDIQAKLLELIKAGSSADVLTYLKSLFGNGTSTDLLAQLKTLLTGSGLSTLDTASLLSSFKSLLGLGDTVIEDEKTALAGILVLDNVNHNTYVSGFPGGAFHPQNYITRADVAVMLYALLTDDSRAMYTSTTNRFSDVTPGSYYYIAVCTMADGGVVAGYPNGTFKPKSYISRAEFATVMTAFYGLVTGASSNFYDVSPNAWYHRYVATASENGWVTGYPDGTFRPQNSITRAEAVTILNSALNRSCDLSYISSHAGWVRSFSDVWADSWYYESVMEAANGHNYTRPTASTETWTGLR